MNNLYSRLHLNSNEITVVRTSDGIAVLYYENSEIIIVHRDNYVLHYGIKEEIVTKVPRLII